MKIKSVSITNVKSFKTTTNIEFDPNFNIVIGPNASGKSNLLDIITISIKKFFLLSYSSSGSQGENGKIRIQQDSLFEDLSIALEKYMGASDLSEIDFIFSIKSEDIENLKICREEQGKFLSFLNSEAINSGGVVSSLRNIHWDESFFKEDDEFEFKIINNQLQNLLPSGYLLSIPTIDNAPQVINNYKQQLFLKYLNYYNLFILLNENFSTKEFKPSFLLLSPYRSAGNDSDFHGNLASNSSMSLSQNLRSTTSKQTTSLVKLATTYFSEKHRQFETEAKKDGYEAMWRNDAEVQLVSSYLNRLGYSWDLKLINRNQNTYEIQLEKQGYKLLLSQASSGEKEIINYLFGIFALKISNGLIIIDEPELHLHPRWQLLLLELFIELTNKTGNQFLITTHSSVFINVNSVSNLIRIFRKERESKHVSLKDKKEVNLKDLLHLVNSTNNEKIFFADLVILVEGVTDRLVFQKIVASVLSRLNILSVVEVVEINGKGNIKKFRKYLKTLEIPYYFIADLDYINQVGTKQIKELFTTDLGAVDSNAIKNPRSTDGKKLIEILEDAISKGDLTTVTTFLEYMKSFRKKLKGKLTPEETVLLEKFIKERQTEKEFILSKGVIEDYFPDKLAAKDLDNVINILKDPQLSEWQKTSEYLALESMIETIFNDAKLI